jgi:hypothetical protein
VSWLRLIYKRRYREKTAPVSLARADATYKSIVELSGIGDLEDAIVPGEAEAVSSAIAVLGPVDVTRLQARQPLDAKSGSSGPLSYPLFELFSGNRDALPDRFRFDGLAVSIQ